MNAATVHAASIDGIALWAPRLPGWEEAAAILRGEREPSAEPARRPAPTLLPPTERRRAPDSMAISKEVAARACEAAGAENREARILDAAGGTGRVALPLAKLGYSVTLCDISLGMLSVAKQKLLREGVLNKVEIFQCDAYNLHFRDESFDFSLCWFGAIDVTKELVRVTKRGGMISMYIKNICHAAISLFSEDPDAALKLLKSPSKFHNSEKYRCDRAIRIEDAAQLFESEGIRVLSAYDTAGGLVQYLLSKEVQECKQWDEGYFRRVAEMV